MRKLSEMIPHEFVCYSLRNTSEEMFSDTNMLIRNCISMKDRQYNGHKKRDKQRSTKHYTKLKIEQHDFVGD